MFSVNLTKSEPNKQSVHNLRTFCMASVFLTHQYGFNNDQGWDSPSSITVTIWLLDLCPVLKWSGIWMVVWKPDWKKYYLGSKSSGIGMVCQVKQIYHLNTRHPYCPVFRCSLFTWLLFTIFCSSRVFLEKCQSKVKKVSIKLGD